MNPVAIIRGALEAIKSEDAQHQAIMYAAVQDELNAICGGRCRCELLAGNHGEATSVVATVFHGHGAPFAQVKVQKDSGTLCGQGQTVAEAVRDLHE